MKTKSTERLKKACEELRIWWASWLVAWHNDDPPSHFPDNFPESVSHYWEPACLELADAYLEARADTLTPWPTITARDIIEIATKFVIAHSPVGLEKVLDEVPFLELLLAELDKASIKFRVLFELNTNYSALESLCCSAHLGGEEYAGVVVGLPSLHHEGSSFPPTLCLELHATDSTRQKCSLAVRDILREAAILSQARECCPSADYEDYQFGLRHG